jgi:hypothetical protein
MEFSPMTAQYGPESGATVNPGPGYIPPHMVAPSPTGGRPLEATEV